LASDDRPNVLFVFTDQQCADAMSSAGNEDLRTPAMDGLAEGGVRFDRAYCTYPLCTPARASMFTGRMPHEVGVNGNDVGIDERYRNQELANLLSVAGYECAYGGKWHVPEISIPESHGFERICGFDDNALAGACAEFLGRRRDRPFFLVASYDNPHNICEWAREAVLPWGSVPAPPAAEDCPNLPANHARTSFEPGALARHREVYRQWGLVTPETPEDWRRLRYAYYRLVEKVDREIGRVMRALQESGCSENTLVFFSSDHGDQNGAHELSHKAVLYEESAWVPFIAAGSGVRGPGRVDSTHLVSNGLDFYATVLDYAGVEAPEGLEGLSLRPLLEGGEGAPWRDHLVVENQEELFRGLVRSRMVRTARYKYVVYEKGLHREQLYDLERDPGEMVNLAVESRYREVIDRHRGLLRDWCRRTGDRFGGGHYAHPETPFTVPGDAYPGGGDPGGG
jgi:arylsulfatase A-like enzyme